MWKIICVDNFGGEGPNSNDTLVVSAIKHEHLGTIMVTRLNDKLSGVDSQNFYRLVDQDYKMQKFEP